MKWFTLARPKYRNSYEVVHFWRVPSKEIISRVILEGWEYVFYPSITILK